ncbi:MAG: methylmalonyl-CoA epimerase [Actinomycetota bacterium]
MMLTQIDHVGIAVPDLDEAVERYRRTFGLEPAHRERVPSQGVEEVLFAVGGSYVQLLGALGPDTPIGRFLQREGPGLHHVGYRVDDVAGTLERLRAEGVRVIDEAPRGGSRGTTIAFVHPSGMGGVLVELVQEAGPPATAAP